MEHVHQLIIDLALILVAAGIITVVFKRLHQPVVLGYILAGLLVGPNFNFFPTILDMDSIKIWADIGVIFLLFSLGLEFSFRKLVTVGGSAAVTGIFEVLCMFFFGYLAGRLMRWPLMDCIFLGGIVAISSTTIISRAFDELQVKTRKFASLVLGVLVIEDLAAVLLLVLLSTVAVSRQFAGWEMLMSVVKLLFFLILWFVSGIYLLPTILKRTRKWMTDETMLIVSTGLCLLMVVLATHAGFSSALGAFIMGSILAETEQGERIEKLISPLKDLFGAVFFVSVGMLINPKVLLQYWLPVLILTLVVVLGKTLNATVGSLIAGQPLKQSLQTGMSLSQIGEFSFIIATLGLNLKVTSSFLYPIAVGVSVITTFSSPYMIRYSEPFYHWLEKKLPEKWLQAVYQYTSGAQKIPSISNWNILLRAYARVIIINLVIIIAIILIVLRYVPILLNTEAHNSVWVTFMTASIALVLIAPFLWALVVRRIERISFSKLWLDKKLNRGPLVLLELFRMVLAVLIIGFLLERLFSVRVALVVAVLIIILFVFLFGQRLQRFYGRIEQRFLRNLQVQKEEEKENEYLSSDMIPWDGHISYFRVPSGADFAGKTLQELKWRENYGINLALIERGNRTLYLPGRDERLFPMDRIAAIGTDEQFENFNKLFEENESPELQQEEEKKIGLMQFVLTANSVLTGKSIRESGIRDTAKGLVVGVERKGERQLNPDSSFAFDTDDVVWIVGDRELIRTFMSGA